jgi:hypothetical protein
MLRLHAARARDEKIVGARDAVGRARDRHIRGNVDRVRVAGLVGWLRRLAEARDHRDACCTPDYEHASHRAHEIIVHPMSMTIPEVREIREVI